MTKYYAGLDVSMKTTNICVVDQDAKVCFESVVSTEPQAIAERLATLALPLEVAGLESGSISHWLVDSLKELGVPAICVDARKLSAVLSTVINKTDKNDARGIAVAMKCGFYTEIHQKSSESVEITTALAVRRTVIDTRTRIKNSIRGLLKTYGIQIQTSGDVSFIESVRLQLPSLPDAASKSIGLLLESFDQMLQQSKALDLQVKQLARENTKAKNLQSIPGIGPITALTYTAEIDDPTRFKKSRSVGAYLGMTPTQYSSGEVVRQGRISKWGSSELRSLLSEAALVLMTRTKSWCQLKAWGIRLMKKVGIRKAMIAVGRKLAVTMHAMMVSGEPFRYSDKDLARDLQPASA